MKPVIKRFYFVLIFLTQFQCGDVRQSQNNELDYQVTYFPDSSVKEIVQKRNGLVDGKAFLFSEDGSKTWEFQYSNGVREGTQLTYIHGDLILVEHYRNGKLEGWFRHYSPRTGLLTEEGQYENNKANGLRYEYYGKELLSISFYKDDSLIKKIYWNKKYLEGQPLPPIVQDCCDRKYLEID